MALFSIPSRPGRAQDTAVAKKVNTASVKAPITIKGSGGLMSQIQSAVALVEKHLGKYRDHCALIQDEETLNKYMDKIRETGILSLDTETTGLNPLLDTIAGVCIYTPGLPEAYIPINHVSYMTGNKIDGQLPADVVRDAFVLLLECTPFIVMFNADFDIRVMKNMLGVKNIYCSWDCYLATRLLNENEPVNKLKPLHQKYVLNGEEDAFTFDELFKGIPFTMVPISTAVLYAAHDPIITYEYYLYQSKYLRLDSEREDLRQLAWVFFNIEMPLVKVVADMEDEGVRFDFAYNDKLKEKYHTLLNERVQAFYSVLKRYDNDIQRYRDLHKLDCKLDDPINIESPQQLAIILYDILGCEQQIDKRTKKPSRSTNEETLKAINNDVAKAVLEYREFSTIVSTFIDKLPTWVNPNDGRIHCNFNQYGADTGRMSSSNPNLQNIPSHITDIRQMFVASEGHVLLSSDYSQQEPSVLAAFCKELGYDSLFNARVKGEDIYSHVASACFEVAYELCCEFDKDHNKNPKEYKQRRSDAKPVLLGILYGRGDPSVAEGMNISIERAQQLKANLYKKYIEIKIFEDESLKMAKSLGYVTTICGRKRRLPDMQLPEYEFKWKDGGPINDDVLDFDSDDTTMPVPEGKKKYYLAKLSQARFKQKQRVFEEANEEGIWIIDNGKKIDDATRQVVNARIQGSAADLTKLAMIDLHNNARLKELGFKLLIPVHDEVIAECPEENAKECSELLAQVMSDAAQKILHMPFACDVEVSKAWYGESIKV